MRQVHIVLSDSEYKELVRKKTKTLREHLLDSVGIQVKHRKMGRPSADDIADMVTEE